MKEILVIQEQTGASSKQIEFNRKDKLTNIRSTDTKTNPKTDETKHR